MYFIGMRAKKEHDFHEQWCMEREDGTENPYYRMSGKRFGAIAIALFALLLLFLSCETKPDANIDEGYSKAINKVEEGAVITDDYWKHNSTICYDYKNDQIDCRIYLEN
jgi:hypothetical protein